MFQGYQYFNISLLYSRKLQRASFNKFRRGILVPLSFEMEIFFKAVPESVALQPGVANSHRKTFTNFRFGTRQGR